MNDGDKDYDAGFESAWKIASQYGQAQLKHASDNPTIPATEILENLLGMMAEFKTSQDWYRNWKSE